MRKFFISDYDGTFYIDEESLTYNITKVKEFREKGNLFAIATGRSFYDFTKKGLIIEYDYLIVNHGATVLDRNHKVIRNYPIDNAIKEDIRKEFGLIDGDNIFVCKCCESRVSIEEEGITKIHIKCSSREEQLRFNNILNTKYKDFVKSYLITGLENCIELISAKTDKSIAIAEVAQIESISDKNIYTIGDSFNDLEMLEAFNGYCMNTSEEFIKERIAQISFSVADVIEELCGGTNE